MSAPDRSPGAPRIVCLGAAHMDRIARADPPFRPRASNPGQLRERTGGAVLNAARALALWGCDVALVSARGGDATARSVEEELEAAGIRDLGVTWLDRASASYTAILDDSGEHVAGIADMAVYDLLSPRVLQRRHLRDALGAADGLIVDANLPAATLEAIGAASRCPVGAIAVSPAKVPRLRGALSWLHVLFASRAEAGELAGLDENASGEELAVALARLGLRRAAITDGPRGVIVLEDGAMHLVEPPPLGAIRDVTGAGDTLAAVAFAAALSGTALRRAVRLGTAAAALHITTGLPGSGAAHACHALAQAAPEPVLLAKAAS